ncbi:MAG TPA: glutathione S-transferase N-terminal domain-containing protein [Gammaproteobacteria bacterium]|nr:glutathione S-transferase N-terminal domain-containing protein [Gammaproteobacteria bacterium]
MKLIGSLSSPYVRKVRIVLAEKQLNHDWMAEDVWAADSTIQQSNPLGKVPCLLLDDGRALYDSRVICQYLDLQPPAHALIPEAAVPRIDVLRWEALADGVLDAGVLIRLEHTQRDAAQRSDKWVARQRGKVDQGLAVIAGDLGGRNWCVGERLTLADIAVGAALGWLSFRLPEIAWRTRYPELGRYYDALMMRPSFQDTAPGI